MSHSATCKRVSIVAVLFVMGLGVSLRAEQRGDLVVTAQFVESVAELLEAAEALGDPRDILSKIPRYNSALKVAQDDYEELIDGEEGRRAVLQIMTRSYLSHINLDSDLGIPWDMRLRLPTPEFMGLQPTLYFIVASIGSHLDEDMFTFLLSVAVERGNAGEVPMACAAIDRMLGSRFSRKRLLQCFGVAASLESAEVGAHLFGSLHDVLLLEGSPIGMNGLNGSLVAELCLELSYSFTSEIRELE